VEGREGEDFSRHRIYSELDLLRRSLTWTKRKGRTQMVFGKKRGTGLLKGSLFGGKGESFLGGEEGEGGDPKRGDDRTKGSLCIGEGGDRGEGKDSQKRKGKKRLRTRGKGGAPRRCLDRGKKKQRQKGNSWRSVISSSVLKRGSLRHGKGQRRHRLGKEGEGGIPPPVEPGKRVLAAKGRGVRRWSSLGGSILRGGNPSSAKLSPDPYGERNLRKGKERAVTKGKGEGRRGISIQGFKKKGALTGGEEK